MPVQLAPLMMVTVSLLVIAIPGFILALLYRGLQRAREWHILKKKYGDLEMFRDFFEQADTARPATGLSARTGRSPETIVH